MKNSIKVERAIKRMTQAQLTESIGMPHQTIVAIESEKYAPLTVLSPKTTRAFDKRIDDTFEFEKSD